MTYRQTINRRMRARTFNKRYARERRAVLWDRLNLVQQPEHPEGYDVTIACFNIIFDNVAIGDTLYLLLPFLPSTDFKCMTAVHKEVRARRGCDVCNDAKLVEEECLANSANLYVGIPKNVNERRVVQIDLVQLPQLLNTVCGIAQLPNEAGFLYQSTEVGHLVPRYLQLATNLSHIGLEGCTLGNDAKKAVQLAGDGYSEFGILWNVSVERGIDNLLDISADVVVVVVWVVATSQIVCEMLQRQKSRRKIHALRENLLEVVGGQLNAVEQGKVFTIGKTLHVIGQNSSAQICHHLGDVEDRRTCEDNLQFGMIVIDELKVTRPALVFMNLIDKQIATACARKGICQVKQGVGGKIEVFCYDIKRLTAGQVLLHVLKKHGGLSDASRPHNAHHTGIPINLIVHITVESACGFSQQFVKRGLQLFHSGLSVGHRVQKYRKKLRMHYKWCNYLDFCTKYGAYFNKSAPKVVRLERLI